MDDYVDDQDFIYRLFQQKEFIKCLKASDLCHVKKSKSISENARAAGNKLYTSLHTQKDQDNNIHNEILLQYNKSIIYATKDSEELAFGFGNRSALFMHLHCYKECIIDVDRALNITESDQLKSKLQSRKEKAVEMLKAEDKKMNISKKLELPDIVKSEKISCATKSVAIEKHEIYGRQLTATRDIKPGEVIIVEKAYACMIKKDRVYLVCSHCLSFAWNGIPCDSCVHSIYCSETCKEEAWAEYHDIECALLPFFHIQNGEARLPKAALTIKILIKAIKAEGFQNVMNDCEFIDNGTLDLFSDGEFNSNKFGYCYSLRCHPKNQNLKFKDCALEALIIYLLIKYTSLIPIKTKKFKKLNSTDEKVLIHLRDILMKLNSIINLNAYMYQSYRCDHGNFITCVKKCDSHKGGLIAPLCAIINHSCVANVMRFTLPQPKIIVYASKPIKKGEQICLSYGPSFQADVAERKLWLEQEMYFTCTCIACTNSKSFMKQAMSEKNNLSKMLKVTHEFRKIFGNKAMDFFLTQNGSKWKVFNEASLKQACKLIELFYKYYEANAAYLNTMDLSLYMRMTFHELYGEKNAVC